MNWDYKNNLTVLSLNIRSLPNKLSKLTNLLSQARHPPTIINLQEIWGTRGNLTLDGYNRLEFYSRESPDMPNSNCGGWVGLYVRKDIDF